MRKNSEYFSVVWFILFLLLAVFLSQVKLIDLETLERFFLASQRSWLTFFWVVVIYIVGSFLFLPLSLMVLATALVFSPGWAFFYSYIGSLAAGAVNFVFGHFLKPRFLEKILGRFRKKFLRHGFRNLILFRFFPIAPYIFVNMFVASIGVKFKLYMISLFLGLIPGTLFITLMGVSLRDFIEKGTWRSIVMFAMIGLIVLVYGIWTMRHLKSKI